MEIDLEEKYVKRFKEVYRKKTNKEIDDAKAREYFYKLVQLVRNIYQPIPKTENER